LLSTPMFVEFKLANSSFRTSGPSDWWTFGLVGGHQQLSLCELLHSHINIGP
jgi:hypothetical protein